MNFELSEEHKAIQKLARDFAVKEILPTVDEDDKAHRFRRDLVVKMAELGFFGTVIPEEYGGTDTGFLSIALITEQIARVHSSLRISVNTNCLGSARTILQWGSEEQKQKYIPPLIDGEISACFAITEPNAGSDVASMTTRAIADGDHYVVNGSKMWISGAHTADIGMLYAYTNPDVKVKGMSAFIIDMNTPGISTEAITEKLGSWSAPVSSITFENVRIPKDALMGKEGEGFKICMSMLDNTRLGCGSGALGVAQACIDAVLQYSNEREQFGQAIGRFQMNQDMIAQMIVETEAARFLVYRAACLKDKGVPNTLETCMGKYAAAEAANKCADYAMKIFGSYGYSEEYPVARYFRDAKLYQIVEGTSNIQKMIIATDALGYRKANR